MSVSTAKWADDDEADLWQALGSCLHDDGGDGSDDDEGEPGYERSDLQRQADCERVREILADGVVSPEVQHPRDATSLLYQALRYDHRHPPEMLKVVVEAGCDVNAPTHASSDELALDCELWLELEGPFAEMNRCKRAYLIAHGARHGPTAATRLAHEAAQAAAREASAAQAESVLEQRLLDARRDWQASRVPMWDDLG